LSFGAAAGLFVVGLFSRIAPLLQGTDTILRQPTEDGYLLLTVARNIALGLGMSTAGGEVPTNGIQPLITFLFAGGYWLVEGDKTAGVLLAMLLSTLIAVAAAAASFVFAVQMLAGHRARKELAAVAAGLWFASPLYGIHTTNALETGLYSLCVVVSLIALERLCRLGMSASRVIGLGASLGVAFWARNDAVFLIASVCLALALIGLGSSRLTGLRAAVATGLVATAVAVPWMWSNFVRFGSIVPVSGRSERMGAAFAENAQLIPGKLFEYVSIIGAVPARFELAFPMPVVTSLTVLGAVAVAAVAWKRSDNTRRALIFAAGGFALLLSVYYGLFFGAAHFVARYLMPASFPLTLLTVVTVAFLLERVPHGAIKSGARILLLPTVALPLLWNVYLRYEDRMYHQHFQVVDWVTENVPPETWVAAVQTGTLGYFHDRSVNLDGKVNPHTLKLRAQTLLDPTGKDHVLEYIRGSRVEYIADWWGIHWWEEILRPDFRILVSDRSADLTVLQRVPKD
jgi:hypothetical protein